MVLASLVAFELLPKAANSAPGAESGTRENFDLAVFAAVHDLAALHNAGQYDAFDEQAERLLSSIAAVPDEELRASARYLVGPTIADALQDRGLSERAWNELFGAMAAGTRLGKTEEEAIAEHQLLAAKIRSNLGDHAFAMQHASAWLLRQNSEGRVVDWRDLRTVGWIARQGGENETAIKAFEGARARGGDHHGTLNPLAEAMWAAGRPREDVTKLALLAADDKERQLIANLTGGDADQRRQYVRGFTNDGSARIISYNVDYEPEYEPAIQLGLNTVLRRKGRVLDVLRAEYQSLRESVKPEDEAAFDALAKARLELATEMYADKLLGRPREDDRVKTLQDSVRRLESKISDPAIAERASAKLVDYRDVQKRIPEDAALVEIVWYREFDVHYKNYDEALHGTPKYAAYVIRPAGTPAVIDLGPAAALDPEVRAFRHALGRNPGKQASGAHRALGRKLHTSLFAPVRAALGDAKHVIIAPDGELNLLPFGALVGDKDRYVLEDVAITYVSSGRDLLRMGGTLEPKSGAVLFGDPDFGAAKDAVADDRGLELASDREPPAPAGGASGSPGLGWNFAPLPGTRQEVEAIRAKLEDPVVFLGDTAGEANLRAVRGPEILHIATHGFFLGTPSEDGGAATRGLELASDIVEQAPTIDDPLLRSGLVLAHPGKPDGSGNDGLMSALELASVDLFGTRIAVLSACETGLGDVDPGEGVFGLRRALVIAGAESQVMSLWKVDDAATRDLMIEYYTRLQKGEGRSEALRQAQLRLAKDPDTAHPYYWAAFLPSGQWSPIGKPAAVERKPEPRDYVSSGTRRRYRRGGGGFGDWISESFDPDNGMGIEVGFSVYAPVPGTQVAGMPMGTQPSLGVGVDFSRRPRLLAGLGYGFFGFELPDHPRSIGAKIHRGDFRMGLDLIALSWGHVVRPSLVGWAGGGLIGGQDIDGLTGDSLRRSAIGAQLGADLGLSFRVNQVAFGLKGGVVKPYTKWSKSRGVPEWAQAHDALRWTVGIWVGPVVDM